MTDRYEKIRKALEMGPTPGPWNLKDGRTDTVENAQGYPVCTVHWHPEERYGHGTRAAYIAACDPDTIAKLLKERDALRDALKEADNELDRLDEDMDTCDHSVGVCMCSYWSMRQKMKAALTKENSND